MKEYWAAPRIFREPEKQGMENWRLGGRKEARWPELSQNWATELICWKDCGYQGWAWPSWLLCTTARSDLWPLGTAALENVMVTVRIAKMNSPFSLLLRILLWDLKSWAGVSECSGLGNRPRDSNSGQLKNDSQQMINHPIPSHLIHITTQHGATVIPIY